MSYFLIGAITVRDVEGYEPYMTGAFASLQSAGGEALAYGSPTAIEGEVPGERIVLIRFADKAACDAWYNSEAYQKVLPVRYANAETPVLIGVEGLAG